MGMSASQVRLLTLQDRKSTIGLRLGTLATQKRTLNRQMTKLANEYNASFSSKKLQWYDTINNNYTDITYANLMTPSMNNGYKPFILTDRSTGKVILDSINATTNSSMHGYSGVDATMAKHMERLTGFSSSEYIPATQSLTQDMEFYIIEDMIGVNDFNRFKMKYTPMENLEKSDPQVNHVKVESIMDEFYEDIGSSVANLTSGQMYLNGNGDLHSDFRDLTLWQAAYESNAVVMLKPSVATSDSAAENAISNIASIFIQELMNYTPIANLESLSGMSSGELNTFKQTVLDDVMKAVMAKDENNNSTVFNPDVSNVDTVLDFSIIQDQDGNNQFAYYSNRIDDPIQSRPEDKLNCNQAGVRQANATISPIKVSYTPDNSQYYYFISAANLMDVAMYYLSLNLEEAESHTDNVLEISDNGNYSQTSFMPGLYANQTSMSIYEAGEINSPSMYSVYSNLNMLNSKLDNITDHPANFPDHAQWNESTNHNKINTMITYIRDFIDGVGDAADESDLIGIANMNAWLSQAMTTENPEEFNELIDKAYAAYSLTQTYDLTSKAATGGWKSAQQNSVLSSGFYYDKGVLNFDAREYLFTQSSMARAASAEPDITSQLTADELNKFEFYKKLVKECLARGWAGNENVTDKAYLDASLTNGKMLIDDDIASNSRRIYEVTNDEAVEEAHSKYESQLTLVTTKEEKIDREMANLQTQQNAINTELDSLEKIINDNIKSTFKMYA